MPNGMEHLTVKIQDASKRALQLRKLYAAVVLLMMGANSTRNM
jgi:hypothetical protein